MSEIVAHLDYTVTDQSGRSYYVNVAGEHTSEGQWEAWLEFLPVDDTDPLLTDTETVQPTRSAVAHWAETLGEAYVQGAFERATLQDAVRAARMATHLYELSPSRQPPQSTRSRYFVWVRMCYEWSCSRSREQNS